MIAESQVNREQCIYAFKIFHFLSKYLIVQRCFIYFIPYSSMEHNDLFNHIYPLLFVAEFIKSDQDDL